MTDSQQRPDLPYGWEIVCLGDIAEINMGQSPPSPTYNDTGDGLPFYQGKTEFGAIYPTPRKWCSAPNKIADEGDVLISVRAPVGPTNICPERSCIGRGLAAVRGLGGIQPRFILYFFRAHESELESQGTGTTFKAISGKVLRSFQIPLAPLPEQRRIVEKIEELFSDLDAGVASLKHVQQQLQRYRQAVLKAAVEGRLTEAWRAQHGHEVEPAGVLLERILAERRRTWEAEELAKYEAKGKTPPKGWQDRYQEPAVPDAADLPELPDGWVWTTVEQLNPATRPCSYGVLKPGSHVFDGIPLVRVGDIMDGKVHTQDMKRISPKIAAQYQRTKLEGGEVLISLVGSIGRTAVVPEHLAGANTARAVGVMPLSQNVRSQWVEIWFRNPAKVQEMTAAANEVARKTLNLEDVRSATVAIPSLAEQELIVGEVERLLSVSDEAEQTVTAELQRSERLRQSILKRAFEGKLVPQDPDDEPASVLLERIQGEKKRPKSTSSKTREPGKTSAPHAAVEAEMHKGQLNLNF